MWFGAQTGELIALSAYTLIAVLEATRGVVRYQIQYEQPGLLEIRLLAREPIDQADLSRQLENELTRRGAISPQIVITPGTVPSVWASSPMAYAKEHHLRIGVTREQMHAWMRA